MHSRVYRYNNRLRRRAVDSPVLFYEDPSRISLPFMSKKLAVSLAPFSAQLLSLFCVAVAVCLYAHFFPKAADIPRDEIMRIITNPEDKNRIEKTAPYILPPPPPPARPLPVNTAVDEGASNIPSNAQGASAQLQASPDHQAPTIAKASAKLHELPSGKSSQSEPVLDLGDMVLVAPKAKKYTPMKIDAGKGGANMHRNNLPGIGDTPLAPDMLTGTFTIKNIKKADTSGQDQTNEPKLNIVALGPTAKASRNNDEIVSSQAKMGISSDSERIAYGTAKPDQQKIGSAGLGIADVSGMSYEPGTIPMGDLEACMDRTQAEEKIIRNNLAKSATIFNKKSCSNLAGEYFFYNVEYPAGFDMSIRPINRLKHNICEEMINAENCIHGK